MKKCIIILLIFNFLNTDSKSQVIFGSYSDLKFIHPHSVKHNHNQISKSDNEIQVVFSALFLFYKSFISSQDQISCGFTPSCSEYGLISVKKLGPIKGMLNTFDRLQRCNGLSPEHYEIHFKTNLLYDPVE
jgi:uncharacterized protein